MNASCVTSGDTYLRPGKRRAGGRSEGLSDIAGRLYFFIQRRLKIRDACISAASNQQRLRGPLWIERSSLPDEMQEIVSRAGYAPAVKVGDTIYVIGQVGRTKYVKIIRDPLEQFRAMWDNLRIVLEAAHCQFDDIVEMTSKCPSTWTCSGLSKARCFRREPMRGPG